MGMTDPIADMLTRIRNAIAANHPRVDIPGSKLIPVGDVANRVNEFPRNKLIVTYCS